MTSSGLLIAGQLHDVAGLTIVPPAGQHGGPSWCLLGPDDYTARRYPVSIVVIHTTGGHPSQPVIPGAGPGGHARQILEMWSGGDKGGGERAHSAAHIVVDYNGTVYCAADLTWCAAYHAQSINHRSVGIEMCTRPDGGIYAATLDATAALVAALTWSGEPACGLLPVPAMMPRGPYRNAPLRRLEVGGVQTDGAGLCGVIGHRDQTAQRGVGDPGDAIWQRVAALGFEGVDYDASEDIEIGKRRQRALNALDVKAGLTWRPLVIDGICGGQSLAAMTRHEIRRWRDVPVDPA